MAKRITAIICTFNRADYLARALHSLAAQTLSRQAYDILIVDNASTDHTREVVDRFVSNQNVFYVHEPVSGLCHARNTGWQSAQTPYVAYLDDDAVADASWLSKILDTFETVTPRPGCVGGKITPIWEAPRPPWLSDEILCGLTVVDWSDTPHVIHNLNAEWLAGANVSFPTKVLEQLNGFSPFLDRVGTRMLSSGDVFLEKQIQKAGYTCFYKPGARVAHDIPAVRLTRGWFMNRYFFQGVSDAVMEMITHGPSRRQRFRLAMGYARELLLCPGNFGSLISPSEAPKRFTKKCFNLITLGHVLGLLRLPQQLCEAD